MQLLEHFENSMLKFRSAEKQTREQNMLPHICGKKLQKRYHLFSLQIVMNGFAALLQTGEAAAQPAWVLRSSRRLRAEFGQPGKPLFLKKTRNRNFMVF